MNGFMNVSRLLWCSATKWRRRAKISFLKITAELLLYELYGVGVMGLPT